MTSKPVPNVKVIDGKVVRKRQFMAGAKAKKAARLAKAWEAKKKPPVETEGQ